MATLGKIRVASFGISFKIQRFWVGINYFGLKHRVSEIHFQWYRWRKSEGSLLKLYGELKVIQYLNVPKLHIKYAFIYISMLIVYCLL